MATVLVAPDGFKGSIDALGAARAVAAGWVSRRPGDRVVVLPTADGGEGTLAAIEAASARSERRPLVVTGPAGAPLPAEWLLVPADDGSTTAIVELASASGIEHLLAGDGLRPLDADTRGVGELIAAALAAGVDRVVVTLGSSASTDGGTGLLRALGARFAAADGTETASGARGLAGIRSVDLSGLPELPPGGVTAIVDVDNPLTGPHGAAAVFGPQKGLASDAIDDADAALARLADLLGLDPATPGLGAAGGTPLALAAWGATMRGGAATVAELVGLDAAIAEADLVITGEGSFDAQSLRGKAPGFVVETARRHGVPAALVAGVIGTDARAAGFADAVSLTELAGDAASARADAARWLAEAGTLLAGRFGGRAPNGVV